LAEENATDDNHTIKNSEKRYSSKRVYPDAQKIWDSIAKNYDME
jgi:hypothetical protein